MWGNEYIKQEEKHSWWPLIGIAIAIWASIIWFACATWGVA